MAFNLYDMTVGQAKDSMAALSAILDKVEASSVADEIAVARLYENMQPFTFQVHSATQMAYNLVASLEGTPLSEWEDTLASYADMRARIAETVKRLEEADKDKINDIAADRTVEIDVGRATGRTGVMIQPKSWHYVKDFCLPNLFFHLVTAYDIARSRGVDLGKLNYLAPFFGRHLGLA